MSRQDGIYEPKLRDEVVRFYRSTLTDIETVVRIQTLSDTTTLLYFFVLSIHQLVLGAFACLGCKSRIAFRSVARSALEYLIDQKLIALLNDPKVNSTFASYHLIFIQSKKGSFSERHHEKLELIEDQFRSYVIENHQDTLSKNTSSINGVDRVDWEKVATDLRRRFRSSWYGKGLKDRLFEVKKRVASRLQIDWTDESDLDQKLQDYDFFITYASRFYESECQYTHPTPYSVVPHFNPVTGNFKPRFNYTETSLRESENFLFLATEYSLSTLIDFLPTEDCDSLKASLESNLRECNNLLDWFYDRKKLGNATRPGNQ